MAQNSKKLNKIYEPKECMKYMNVEVHPTLLSKWYMADVPRELDLVNARLVPAPELYASELLVWTRTVPRTLEANSNNGQVHLSEPQSPCEHALYISTAEELSESVTNHTLSAQMKEIKNIVDAELTLIVFGAKNYFKTSRRKTNNSNRTTYTEIDLEMAIADLLVSARCDVVQMNSPNELALLIAQLTKAVAEAPYKKANAIDQEFYMKGDSKKCVAINSDGAGVARLWQQMLAVLPQSSLETSRALCQHYKTPLDFYNACQEPASVRALADVGVSRAAAPGALARRVGPELARRLHSLFTATDGDMIID